MCRRLTGRATTHQRRGDEEVRSVASLPGLALELRRGVGGHRYEACAELLIALLAVVKAGVARPAAAGPYLHQLIEIGS